MSAPIPPLQVDVTGWLIARLTEQLAARVGGETPADPSETLDWIPFVRVVRIGGPDDNHIVDIPTMAFHCFAANQPTANGLGYQVIGAVRALRAVTADGATVQQVRKLSGPMWAATSNQALRHAVVLMQLRIKTTG